MILVLHWQFNALMFLALQHSTYAAIHYLGHLSSCSSYVFGGCGFTIISEISPSDTRGKLEHCSCILLNKMREEIKTYCAVVFQSGGCLPPFAEVVSKRYKTMLWRAEVHLNMSTYPQRNSSG